MRNGGAAHKNMETPRSIHTGDAMSWHSSHQSPVTSHQSPAARSRIRDTDRLSCRSDFFYSGGGSGFPAFYLRNVGEDKRAFVFTADDMEAALFSEEGEQDRKSVV